MRTEDIELIDDHDQAIEELNDEVGKLQESTAFDSERIDKLEWQIRSLKHLLIHHGLI